MMLSWQERRHGAGLLIEVKVDDVKKKKKRGLSVYTGISGRIVEAWPSTKVG